ncbi:MAG: hypothetical protein U0R44_02850 [Candidatus Micrarchaeia archaeon]
MAQPRTHRRMGEAEETGPITIVPTRRVVDARQAARLREELPRVLSEVDSLVAYARSLRVPASGRTSADITSEAGRLESALDRMALSSVPVLGERYSDELQIIRRTIGSAKTAGREGRIGDAVTLLQRANAQISGIGQVFELQLGFLMNGVPSNASVQGVPPEDVPERLLRSAENAFLDIGTQNEPRGRMILSFLRLYNDNAPYYNSDDENVRAERDTLFRMIVVRGDAAGAREAYTAEQAREDTALISSFRQNAERIRSQIVAHNIAVFASWRSQLQALIEQQTDEGVRRNMEVLRRDLDGVLRRLNAQQEVASEEMRTISSRYFLLSGRSSPPDAADRTESLRSAASDLRGTASAVREYSPEWFGAAAQTALREGRTEAAALAISMGLLERMASRSPRGARDYISSYEEIRQVIAGRRSATPGMLGSYAGQIDAASIIAEADRIVMDNSAGPNRQKRERVVNAAGMVRERMRRGDIAGARRLLEMDRFYIDTLQANRWRGWTGSDDMEGAIDDELAGRDGSARFGRSQTFYQFSTETARFRSAIADWSRGVSAQRQLVENGLGLVESLAREGNASEARRVLTLLVMYVDSVERLAVRRGGALSSISAADVRIISGMGDAIGALLQHSSMVGARQIEDVFMESFALAQRSYVVREAARLGTLSARREFGRDTINDALAAARRRAESGDYRGAISLLEYVREFYGSPAEAVPASGDRPRQEARAEGWRYGIFAARFADRTQGFASGRQEMLEAVRMEMNADSVNARLAAAQLFDRGSRRIAQTDVLVREFVRLRQRFDGVTPFVEGNSRTIGLLPLGERQADGTYPQYFPLATVRAYEAAHPDDSLLRGGTTLADIMRRMDDASHRGDLRLFESLSADFGRRFELVGGRALRQRSLEQSISQLSDLRAAITEIRGMYGSSVPAAVAARLDSLEGRRAFLERNIRALVDRPGEMDTRGYSELLADFDRERRLGMAYSVVSSQIDLNEQFRRMVVGQSQGTLMSFARTQLARCLPHLQSARTALIDGDLRTAESEYTAAMYERRIGLGMYQAENALTVTSSGSWTRGITEMGRFIGRAFQGQSFEENARQVGGETPPGMASPEYEGYQRMQTDAFHDILFGRGTRADQERINNLMNTARLVELSVFSIPADNMSQAFSNFIPDQRTIRDLARDAATAYRAGNTAEGNRLAREAETTWRAMSARAEDNQWWGNAATVVFALGVSLVPGGGWVVGGAIMTTMAFERVVTEINLDGHASNEAWGMLALSIATMGLGGAGAAFRTFGLEAQAAGNVTNAARLLAAARAINYVNLGIGSFFAGYLGGQAYDAFRQGHTRDGVLLAGMALFPFAHMAGARAFEVRARGRQVPSAIEVQAVLDELNAGAGRPRVRIEPTETAEMRMANELRVPERLFQFLRDFIARDAAGRTAMLEGLPQSMRQPVRALAENPAIQRAMQPDGGGLGNDLASALIRRTIEAFEVPSSRASSQPVATRTQWEGSRWVRDGEALRGFIRDLLVPDDAPQARLNARDVARARLEAMRGESPQIAGIIDGMLRNPSIAADVNSGESTALSQRMFNSARERIGRLLPDDVEASEQRATAAYNQQLEMAAGYNGPQMIERGAAQDGRPMDVRASAGEQGGRPGQAPPRAVEPQTRQGTAVQPPQAQPQEQIVRGPTERAVRAVGRGVMGMARWLHARYAAPAAREVVATQDQFAEAARGSIERTIGSAVRPQEMPMLIEEAGRGLDPAAQADLANSVRSAPQRLADMMRALYRRAVDTNAPRPLRELAWRALGRLYSYDNVRAALEPLARSDPALRDILSRTDATLAQGARTGRVPLETFRQRLARAGMGIDEVNLLVDTIEAQQNASMGTLRARLGALESEIPRMEDQLRSAERTRDAASGRARERAEARVRMVNSSLQSLRAEAGRITETMNAPENLPLGRTERLLGIRFSPSERATTMLRLLDAGVISGESIVPDLVNAENRAVRAIDAMETGNPVADALRQALRRGIGNGMSLDDALLSALRNDEVASALARRHGARLEGRFREAVRSGSLEEVMGRVRDMLPTAEAEAVGSFTRSVRAGLADDFAVMRTLNDRAGGVIGQTLENAGAFGERLAPARQQILESGPFRAGSRILRGLGRGIRYLYWGMGRNGYAMLRSPEAGFSAMPYLRGGGLIAAQLGIWAYSGYLLRNQFRSVYDRISGSATIEEGRREVQREWGVNISEANARFVREGAGGRDFLLYLPNRFPAGRDRRPGNAEELRRLLASQDIIIDPSRMDDVLTDGRTMSGQLAAINTLLATRRTGGADASSEATAELTRILGGFGMTVEAVDRLLAAERKQSLDITDMADLRMDDWVRRGIAVRLRDVVIETFLADSGMSVVRGQGAAQFLSQNQDVFVYLWQAVQSGFLPVSYVDDAVELLMRQGTLAGIRGRVSGTVTLDSQLREALVGGNLIFEVPTGTGSQVQGILQNSFLGLLDRRASLEPAFRPAFEALLARYRGNAAALTAFNGFHVTEGDRGEELYGDMNALAELIIQNPRTAIDLARQRGLVGPALLVQTDPSLRSATDVVQFVAGHSDTAHDRGMLAWIRQRRDQIVSLGPILRDLAGNAQAASMNATDIQAYADRQAERFRTQGWWRGPTPTELAADAERARERARTMPGGQQVVPPTRADQLGAEGRQQYPRRSGFEAAPQDTVPVRTADQPQVTAPAPSLSAEAVSFYNSERSAGLAPFIEGLLTRIYEQTTGDGATLRQTYGEDRDRAVLDIKAELYRIITSANPRDATLRRGWGITVRGHGESLTIEIDMRRARDPIRNRAVEFARERRAGSGAR